MRAEHDRHQHGGLPRKISEPNVQDLLLISAPPSQELQVEMILIIMEKSTAILYWFCPKKRCFVTIKIIFWLSVHNYLIVFHAEAVSSCKRIWKQFQYLIWFLLYLSEVYNFIGMDVDLFGHWWFYLFTCLTRFPAFPVKGSSMGWILSKETLS